MLALAACSGPSPLDAPDAGRTSTYEPGLPSLDLEAIPAVRDGEPGITAYTSIPQATLVFTRTDEGYAARYDVSLRVKDEQGRATESFSTRTDTVAVDAPEATRAPDRIGRQEWVPLAPGVYVIEAALEDLESGERAVRQQRVEVPTPTGAAMLGRPLVRARLRPGGPVEPVVALHLPARRDSLSVEVAAYDAPPGATLSLHILRLRADTSVAVPPFWLSPSRGSLAFRGLDAGDADTVRVAQQRLDEAAEQTVSLDLPDLRPGVYRLDLRLSTGGIPLARQQRILSVKGPGFPQLATLAELVDALAYIGYPRETEFIREGTNARERRRRFDAFWGTLVPDRRVAANLLRTYYERVEEANRLFTSVKPGWKTDRGMVYVVFGAPEYVERTFEGEVWYYAYGAEDPASTFAFERADYYSGSADPFGHHVLVRQAAYERPWVRAVQRWREGTAL
ncbi:MAG: GWxTD domain-containing protein [Bacteroidota bacterium]